MKVSSRVSMFACSVLLLNSGIALSTYRMKSPTIALLSKLMSAPLLLKKRMERYTFPYSQVNVIRLKCIGRLVAEFL